MQTIALILLLMVACLYDWRFRKIPNGLVLGGLLIGLGLSLQESAVPVLSSSIGGLFVGLMIFLPFYAAGWVGAGDAKLVAMVGSFAGPAGVAWISLFTFVAGGALAVLMLTYFGGWTSTRDRISQLFKTLVFKVRGVPIPFAIDPGSSMRLPYAIAIFAGTLVWLWREGRLLLPGVA